jgi:hypothetical protein
MKRHFAAAVLAAFVLVAPAVRAQTAPASTVFSTVEGVEVEASRFTITGVVQGEPEARAVQFHVFSYASPGSRSDILGSCERFALVAMSKPGEYLLHVYPGTSSGVAHCKLTLANP